MEESRAAGGREPDTSLDDQCRRDLEHCGCSVNVAAGTPAALHRNLPDLRQIESDDLRHRQRDCAGRDDRCVNNAGSTVMELRADNSLANVSNERQLEWNESRAAGGRKPDNRSRPPMQA